MNKLLSIRRESTSVRSQTRIKSLSPRQTAVLLALFLSLPSHSDEQTLRDPALRDEDISSLSFVANVAKSNDLYVYSYTISAPDNSVSYPDSFSLDIACPNLPSTTPEKSHGGTDKGFYYSMNGKHAGIDISIPKDLSFNAGVTAFNEVTFDIPVLRGKTKTFTLMSPSPPTHRQYHIDAETIRNERLYDYSNVDESEQDDPAIPSDSDWEVWGVTLGPACSNQVHGPNSQPIFDGQKTRFESRRINQLLRFELEQRRNRFHASASQATFRVKVLYAQNIDPSTFRAHLNNTDISQLFQPAPGTEEWVEVPLDEARSRITLSVYEGGAVYEDGSMNERMLDIDPFEIRRP